VTIKTVSFSASALCWLPIRLAHFGAAGATNPWHYGIGCDTRSTGSPGTFVTRLQCAPWSAASWGTSAKAVEPRPGPADYAGGTSFRCLGSSVVVRAWLAAGRGFSVVRCTDFCFGPVSRAGTLSER
jgi:hypothetical protein